MSEASDYQAENGGNVFTVEVRDGDEPVDSAEVRVVFHNNEIFGLMGSISPENLRMKMVRPNFG